MSKAKPEKEKENLTDHPEEAACEETAAGTAEKDTAKEAGDASTAVEDEAAGAEATDEAGEKQEESPQEDNDARYMRLAADFQNFKRRTEKEKADIYQFANEKIALDIIDVMDNFERAMAHSEESSDKQFVEGIAMIYKQLKGVLDKNNIIEIKAENEPFDPNFHNAVMTEENPDFESGIVIQALQKGYTLNGKVIRPSMVKVAQ